MKKVIFTLISTALMFTVTYAQYCGNNGGPVSGPSQCSPPVVPSTVPGLTPVSDSLPPVVNGVASDTVIQFVNYDSITRVIAGTTYRLKVNSLKIDSIGNLPAGMCWATNKANNTFANRENGCIRVSGTPCADPGQYKLKIIVDVNVDLVGNLANQDAEASGLRYFVRVINSGDATIAVDTLGGPFVKVTGYSASSSGCTGVGINDLVNSFNSLNVVPNPFNGKSIVSFFANKAGLFTERITNMLGAEVYKNKIEAKAGENSTVIDRGSLPQGVYFYSITDGKNSVTKRIVIAD